MAIVWQLSIRQHSAGSTIRGVILADNPNFYRLKRGGVVNMLRVIRSYFVNPVKHKQVQVDLVDQSVTVTTDKYGEFSIDVNSNVEKVVEIRMDGSVLEYAFDYPTLFPLNSGLYEVVSDIDDTIMISYTADTIRRVMTLLFTSPLKRSRIDFTHSLANYLNNQGVRISYVSKSESNLFAIIAAFLRHHNFPQGDLFLTPYLGFKEMLASSKKRTFKEDTISRLIQNSSKQFILLGDDSQRDMDVYASISEEYTERIYRVYIRQTKRKMKLIAQEYLNRLEATGVDVVVFSNTDDFDNKIDLN